MQEPMVWVASRPYHCNKGERVPLALFDRACWRRDTALKALNDAEQAHHIVLSSESVSGIRAAIATGLAVGVVARSSVESSMQILDEQQGFPTLPQCVLRLARGTDSSPAIDAMVTEIESGFATFK